MKLLDRIFHKAPAAPLPERVQLSHSFQVDDQGKLSMEARSLDEFDRNSHFLDQAQSMADAARSAEALKNLDGKKADYDPRAGHVVAPEHNFEFHPDSGEFTQNGLLQVKGNDQQVVIGKSDSSYGETGVWNREEQSFRLNYWGYQVADQPGGIPYQLVPDSKEVSFPVDANGAALKPAVHNLAEAKALGIGGGDQDRAHELLQSAQVWHSQALGMDGGIHDLNPQAQNLVAPKVSPDQISQSVWGAQAVISQEEVDLQADPHNLLVRGRDPEAGSAVLSATTTPEGNYEVSLHDYRYGEKVVWNKNDGTLSYQILAVAPRC